jgi:succinoglycan biosynthesis protein ExoA
MSPLASAPPVAASRDGSTPSTAPFISVIVPVRNEGAFIAQTLMQLLDQDYPADRFEVLVADGGSTDDTRAIVAALAARRPNLRLLDNPKRWSSAGRNVATRGARGDIVLLIDGHCEIDNRRYLHDLTEAFFNSGADCVGRPQPLDVTRATPLQRAIALARSSRLGHHPASHIYSDREGFVPPQSVAVAYRREVFDAVGDFDERFDACEDVEFNHRVARAGMSCFFSPRVRVRYHPRDSLGRLFRQMMRYGRGRVRLLRKHPDTFSLPGFLPAAFLAGLLLGPLLGLLLPLLWLPYGGALAVYAFLVTAASASIAWRKRAPGLLPLLPAVFPTIHLGAGAGLLWEALAGRRKRNEILPSTVSGRTRELLAIPVTPREATPSTVRPPLNALTIDVEDYFQVSGFDHIVDRAHWGDFSSRVEASTHRLLDRLAEAGAHATFFVLGWVAERHPRLVRSIRAAGHEIGCHSYWHRLIYDLTPEQFRRDLREGLDVLEDILGEPVTCFRAPSFSITRRSLWALDILIEEGVRIDSSIYPTHHDRYGIPGTPLAPHRIEREAGGLWEFPPPVLRRLGYPLPLGGGGYFRLFPYALTRAGLGQINRDGRPFAAYLHPWEVDPRQPRLKPGVLRGFRHYVNLRRTEPRLRRLLRDFRFGTLSESLADFEPSSRPVVAPPLSRAA